MAFQVSPGVLVQEIDATNVIPAVSSSTGAYVGHFGWGPSEEVRTVLLEKDLLTYSENQILLILWRNTFFLPKCF